MYFSYTKVSILSFISFISGKDGIRKCYVRNSYSYENRVCFGEKRSWEKTYLTGTNKFEYSWNKSEIREMNGNKKKRMCAAHPLNINSFPEI